MLPDLRNVLDVDANMDGGGTDWRQLELHIVVGQAHRLGLGAHAVRTFCYSYCPKLSFTALVTAFSLLFNVCSLCNLRNL